MKRNSQPQKPFMRKYRSTFYIFPALIPLLEIVPWLLASVGGLASLYALMVKHKKWVFGLAGLCFISAVSLYGYNYLTHGRWTEQAQEVKAENLPQLVHRAQLPPPQSANSDKAFIWDISKKPEKIWSIESQNEFLSNMALTDDRILIGTYKRTLDARSMKDGELLWSLQRKEPVYATPLVEGNKIFIGEGLHTAPSSGLAVASYPDGEVLWERRFSSHVESYPTLDGNNNRLFICAGALGLWSFTINEGQQLWHAAIGHIDSAPLLKNDRLFTAARLDEVKNGSAFFELSPNTGKVIARQPLEGNPMSNIIDLDNGHILLATAIGQIGLNLESDKGWVYALDTNKTGDKILWKTKLPTMMLPDGQLSSDKKTIWYTLKNGEIWALDTRTGERLWSKRYGREFRSTLALYEHKDKSILVAQTVDGIVHIIDGSNGAERQSLVVEPKSYVAPALKGDMLYIATPFFMHKFKLHGTFE